MKWLNQSVEVPLWWVVAGIICAVGVLILVYGGMVT